MYEKPHLLIRAETTIHPSLEQLIAQLDQTDNMSFRADWHLESNILTAYLEGIPIGFLRFVIQRIGVEEDLEPIQHNDKLLTEAKVLAFGVTPEYRRRGIGRELQLTLIEVR